MVLWRRRKRYVMPQIFTMFFPDVNDSLCRTECECRKEEIEEWVK